MIYEMDHGFITPSLMCPVVRIAKLLVLYLYGINEIDHTGSSLSSLFQISTFLLNYSCEPCTFTVDHNSQ